MKISKPVADNERGYAMLLANGDGWHFTAAEGLTPWLERLASILELKIRDQNGYPKLIFIRGEIGSENKGAPLLSLDPNILENLPGSGWKAHKFPAIKIWSHRDVPDVILEMGNEESHELDISRKSLALHPIFQAAQRSGGLPLHGALVEREGQGLVLAAQGNVGKSTCCLRLPSPWLPLCDDKTLIVRDDRKRYLAHPFPTWSDYLWRRSEKTWPVERHVPLSAIFFLGRGKIDRAISIGHGQAAVSITRSALEVYQPYCKMLDSQDTQGLRSELFDNACELSLSIPAFKLLVSRRGRFWEAMEQVLT